MISSSTTQIAKIEDFREAEINAVPALFTSCRIDPATLPEGLYACEVASSPLSAFLWLVPRALENFFGTVITRRPLLQEQQGFREITRYGIYGRMEFDEWSESDTDV